MKTTTIAATVLSLALPALVLALTSCNRPASSGPPKAPEDAAGGESHAGHAAEGHAKSEEQERSDLDRPAEELFIATCEHGKKTFECDECRYGIGVVRAPRKLFDGGLVTLAKAGKRRVAAPIQLTGEVRFDERRVAHVSSQIEGIIKKVYVTLGDKVNKGQPLIELESVDIGEAQAAYLAARANFDIARLNFKRAESLRQQKINSEKEYLEAKREFDAARIQAEGALGKLTRLGMDGAEARGLTESTARGRLVLRAPVDGSVLLLPHAVPGEMAKTEESLATVGDNSTVWVWTDIYERDIEAVAGAQGEQLAAAVAVKAYPNETFDGTVDFVSPAMDETSRTVKVRVQVHNRSGKLLAGMFAAVRIFLPGAEEALAVPKEAVLDDEGRSFVFVHHHDDYYVRRAVTTGRSWAGWVEVKQGLSVDQSVVAEGAFLMKSDVLRSKMGAGCAD